LNLRVLLMNKNGLMVYK